MMMKTARLIVANDNVSNHTFNVDCPYWTKGITSCVWQNSNLRLALPNLPQECIVVVTECNGSSELGVIKSTKFEKNNIVKVLRKAVSSQIHIKELICTVDDLLIKTYEGGCDVVVKLFS